MRIRVREVKTRISLRVLERKNLPKFGEAVDGEGNVTTQSPDFVFIDHPDDQQNEDADDPAMGSTLANFILKQQERNLAREFDIDSSMIGDRDDRADVEGDNVRQAATDGKYVPPGARHGNLGDGRRGGLENAFSRQGSGGDDQNNDCTIRVSNLTKAVTEEDLRDLFSPFGRIHRVSLPKIERKTDDGHIIKEPKGFAYIAYVHKSDAERAMEKLQGHGYDHLILKLEWAKPPKEGGGPPSGGLSSSYVSGYGQKLAQDTKEQVSYASNLTGNR